MTMRGKRFGQLGAILLGSALALAAEAPRFGIQVQGSAPTGSMRSRFTEGTGVGLGAFADWELDAGSSLRLAYDGFAHPRERDARPFVATGPAPGATGSRSPRTHALTLQYRIFPGGDNEGFYFLAGAGAMKYRQDRESTLALEGGGLRAVTLAEDSGVHLATLAGLGWESGRNWGLCARYTFLTLQNHTLGAAQVGLSYRF